MLFHSYTFFVFLALFTAVYFPVRLLSHRAGKIVLLLFSYVFYAWTYPPYLALLVTTTLIDYFCAFRIGEAKNAWSRKAYLILTLSVNLGMLAYFKYAGFFLNTVAGIFGSDFYGKMNVILPIGVSFYTFESLSYTIDVYRGRIKPERHLLNYAFFISFFPHLVAGPIVLAHDFLDQLKSQRRITADHLVSGLFLVIYGFFMKAVIADHLAPGVDHFFAHPELYSAPEAWLQVYSYALQIFGDFAGYSSIAIGLARMMGYRLPRNFNDPYLATSLTDFWRRWHMSLSTWLKEYLYISLGGNRKGEMRMYFNLLLTMLLGGLWHGASWNFVIWGGIHGIGLVVEKMVMRHFPRIQTGALTDSLPLRIVRILVTFHLVCLAWVFFRAPTFLAATSVLHVMIPHGGDAPWFMDTAQRLALKTGAVILIFPALRRYWRSSETSTYWSSYGDAVAAALGLYLCLAFGVSAQAFIYFQF